jgi:DNA-nicking Smr family endonuclease
MRSRRTNAPPAPPPEPDEAELFRRAVEGAKPLEPLNRADAARPARKPKPRPLDHDPHVYGTLSDVVAMPREPGEPLSFARPGMQKELRELRRGRGVESELDLHGLTIAQARELLVRFLVECREHGIRRVRIIHGKGLGSETGEGVLKASVASWLAQWNDVLAFAEAPLRQGGGGAVIVLLKSQPR